MAQDDVGRSANVVAFEQSVDSPVAAMAQLGTRSFSEPLLRRPAAHPKAEISRQDRQVRGHVKWRPESRVPDVGGLGWRTRTGHLLKNQAYYSQKPNVNRWDEPVHAGVNTWKEYHGPKLRTDADMMERLDEFDSLQGHQEAERLAVNTQRAQIVDLFYNQKLQRDQFQTAPSWAPHLRAKREVHSQHERFMSDIDEKPRKELKKIMTNKVLDMDRFAVRSITQKIQTEETWKQVYKDMEMERRHDLISDFQHRQAHNDKLMELSGQPLRRTAHNERQLPNSCTPHVEALARPKKEIPMSQTDVTRLTEFRGLHHADHEHALEVLYPGFGHELSHKFRDAVSKTAEVGWPPPPPAMTPRKPTASERRARKNAVSITTPSPPVTQQRLERVGTRARGDMVSDHAQMQFLPTRAPPPPDQRQTLLKEDWKTGTLLRDKDKATGSFQRTDHVSSPSSPLRKLDGEDPPPPLRSLTYPVIAPLSPKHSRDKDEPVAPDSPFGTMARNLSAPSLLPSSEGRRKAERAAIEREAESFRNELAEFEARAQPVPRLSNFFGTPRATRTDRPRIQGEA